MARLYGRFATRRRLTLADLSGIAKSAATAFGEASWPRAGSPSTALRSTTSPGAECRAHRRPSHPDRGCRISAPTASEPDPRELEGPGSGCPATPGAPATDAPGAERPRRAGVMSARAMSRPRESGAAMGGAFDGPGGGAGRLRTVVTGEVAGFGARRLRTCTAPAATPWDGGVSGPLGVEGSLRSTNSWSRPARGGYAAGGRCAGARRLAAAYDARGGTLDLGRS